ncbi:DgyrCDS933 [Dimorphilus gyrociliatus]|uniref:DgyrCDS933 n=1 Tax=Dimorphilus gyrociliatus TaxID=2664684 RepID=A0A7I8V645_9ANNE|nr:DgyrCDS933 [Dimorphilus gyrociliatus]
MTAGSFKNCDSLIPKQELIVERPKGRSRHRSSPSEARSGNFEKDRRTNSLTSLHLPCIAAVTTSSSLENLMEERRSQQSQDSQEIKEVTPSESCQGLLGEKDNWRSTVFQPTTFQKVLVVFVLTLANILNYMDRYTVAGVLKLIEIEFFGEEGNNRSQLGLLQTAFVISYMIFSPIFGFLGDRYNRKALMIVGIGFWSVITLVSSFVTKNYWTFLLMRALVGIGEASYSTIAPTIIADYFIDGMRSKMLAVFYFAIPVGSGLGYIMSSGVAKAASGEWAWSFRVTPILGVFCIFGLFFIRIPARGASEGAVHLKNTSLKKDIKYLLANGSFMFSTLGFTCVSFVAGALALWTPYYISDSLKVNFEERGILQPMSKETINITFGVCTCITGLLGVAIGATSARFLRRWTQKSDPIVCGIGLAVAAPTIFIAIALSCINLKATWAFIFISELFLSLNWSIVADILMCVVIPTRRSMAEAIQILISHAFGDAGSPFLVGQIADGIGKIVCSLGAICFFATAHFISKDRKAVNDVVHKGEIEMESSNTNCSVIGQEKPPIA